jgi:hypothetical protein
MLGDGGLRQTYFIYNIVADTGFLRAYILQYGNPGRIGKHLEYGSKFVLFGIEYLCLGNTHNIFIYCNITIIKEIKKARLYKI